MATQTLVSVADDDVVAYITSNAVVDGFLGLTGSVGSSVVHLRSEDSHETRRNRILLGRWTECIKPMNRCLACIMLVECLVDDNAICTLWHSGGSTKRERGS